MDGADQILTSHLNKRITAYKRAASAVQNEYSDIVALAKSRQREIGASRQLGGLLADDDHQQSGGDFAELFYRLVSDEDFQTKKQEIHERYQPEMAAVQAQMSEAEEDEKTVAKALSEKYGVQFTNAF
jgi:ribosomal protein S17E